jgi:hypothetical protein
MLPKLCSCKFNKCSPLFTIDRPIDISFSLGHYLDLLVKNFIIRFHERPLCMLNYGFAANIQAVYVPDDEIVRALASRPSTSSPPPPSCCCPWGKISLNAYCLSSMSIDLSIHNGHCRMESSFDGYYSYMHIYSLLVYLETKRLATS